jgi:hypothetical protein
MKFFKSVIEKIKFDFYYPIVDALNTLQERLERSFSFAVIGWKNYDFDSAYVYNLMSFKLKRVREALVHGDAVHEDVDLEALVEAINICDRLFLNDYDNKYHEAHSLKWGEFPDIETDPIYNESGDIIYYRMRYGVRPNVKNQEDMVQETKEFLTCYDNAEKDRLSDIDKLCDILKNHERAWWD